MGCEPYLVSSAIIAVMAQRLVRRICPNCKLAVIANETERRFLNIPPERGEVKIHRGAGCSRCARTGYYDRIGVYEMVPFDPGLCELVMQKASTERLCEYAVNRGEVTLRQDALKKVLHGETTMQEAIRVTGTED